MTLKEIQDAKPTDFSTNSWLREVCIQLALLNEKRQQQLPKGQK